MLSSTVSAQWLHQTLQNQDDAELIILDARLKAGDEKVDQLQIKGARFLDMKGSYFRDPEGSFPNTFPKIDSFEKGAQQLGINNESKIIVYDNIGIYSAPRIWWLFKTYGHKNVFVLEGGLTHWINEGYETETFQQNQSFEPGNFIANLHADRVKFFDYISTNTDSNEAIVIDARSASRFNGEAKEPRAGLRSGHIPNSINIPYKSLLDEKQQFKSTQELEAIFRLFKYETRPILFSCGSGITACIVLQAAESVLENELLVYDGSWTEYGTLTNE